LGVFVPHALRVRRPVGIVAISGVGDSWIYHVDIVLIHTNENHIVSTVADGITRIGTHLIVHVDNYRRSDVEHRPQPREIIGGFGIAGKINGGIFGAEGQMLVGDRGKVPYV
jgi:hypothetical protein